MLSDLTSYRRDSPRCGHCGSPLNGRFARCPSCFRLTNDSLNMHSAQPPVLHVRFNDSPPIPTHRVAVRKIWRPSSRALVNIYDTVEDVEAVVIPAPLHQRLRRPLLLGASLVVATSAVYLGFVHGNDLRVGTPVAVSGKVQAQNGKTVAVLPQKAVTAVAQKPVAVVAQKPATTVAQKPVTVVAQTPVTTAAQKPVAAVAQPSATTATQKSVTAVAQAPATTAVQKPVAAVAQTPATTATQKPVAAVAQTAATTAAQKSVTAVAQAPATTVVQKSVTAVTQAPATTAIQKSATAVAQTPATTAAQKSATAVTQTPATTVVQKSATAVAQTPATTAVQKSPTAVAQTPATTAAQKPVTAVAQTSGTTAAHKSVTAVTQTPATSAVQKSVTAVTQTPATTVAQKSVTTTAQTPATAAANTRRATLTTSVAVVATVASINPEAARNPGSRTVNQPDKARVDVSRYIRAARAGLQANNLTTTKARLAAAIAAQPDNRDALNMRSTVRTREQQRDALLSLARGCGYIAHWACVARNSGIALSIDSSSKEAQRLAALATRETQLQMPPPAEPAADPPPETRDLSVHH